MTDLPHVPFNPPVTPSTPQQGGSPSENQPGGGPKRRRRGGRNRNRSGAPQAAQPLRYEDEADDPWAQQHDLPEVHDTPAVPEHHEHHLKIEFPVAFEKLGLEPALLHSLADIHFTVPSEIQEKMIPVALAGVDVLGQTRTGTGKTAAFGLPILQKLDLTQPFQALIVVPTRELAVQVEAEMRRFAKHKPVRLRWLTAARRSPASSSNWGISHTSSSGRRAASWTCRNAGRWFSTT